MLTFIQDFYWKLNSNFYDLFVLLIICFTFSYPVATMIGQSFGSILVGMECLCKVCPDVYIDTIGAAFTYPFARILGGAKVITYTHYPIISSVSYICM